MSTPRIVVLLLLGAFVGPLHAQRADLILHGGKVVTVDRAFSIRPAVAVHGGKILLVGSDDEVLKTRGPNTRMVDLQGRMVLPGLIDSHTHPTGACLTEFEHPIPDMPSVDDVLKYIRERAAVTPEGDWIQLRQVFITRLREQRYPTRAELDAAAPRHPVIFSTGHDASINSLALRLSGIDKDFRATGNGKIERDPATGEPTGILRGAANYVKVKLKERAATPAERDERLRQLFADYNSVGLTGIIDRDASSDGLAQFERLRGAGQLTVRVAVSMGVSNRLPLADAQKRIQEIAGHALRHPDPWLRIIGVKTYLDGGMLTGSAYLREPWGVSQIYAIDDPRYRGLLFIEPGVLAQMVQTTVASGMQFTAHSVGDGAVHALLDAYESVNRSTPIAPTRPCLTHSNFMSREAVERAARLGVVADIQPAWLYLDAHTLRGQFGDERLRYFQPLRSLFAARVTVGGGSDHMQKIGSLRSINPYNPFLGMATAITRRARLESSPVHPEEALSREQAIRFYTANNAVLMFLEDQVGSLEVGKRADLIVLDRDLLTCAEDDIRDTQVLQTYLDGKCVYERPAP